MRTSEQYLQSLRDRPPRLFVDGERVPDPTAHPKVRPSINAVAQTYALANDPDTVDLASGWSDLIDGRANRFTRPFLAPDDLTKKLQLQRILGRRTGTCFQRCVGMDAINALWVATWGAPTHDRFLAWLTGVQRDDDVVCGAMTDAKGDRRLRPTDQPEQFVRVVERRPDGVVLRGAKLHQTGGANSHWIAVLPGGFLKPGEEDFGIACAVRADAPGVTMVLGRQPSDGRRGTVDAGNPRYGGQEVVILFEDVFVPTSQVFIDGDLGACGTMLDTFASFHRASYGGCKPGNLEVMTGAAAELVELHGIGRNRAVRDKLVEMVHLTETVHGVGLAASSKSTQHPSGIWLVDPILANACKQNVTRLPYEVGRIAEDLAGGLIGTMPSLDDLDHPELGPGLRTALGSDERVRMLRLVEWMTYGAGAVALRLECMHGAGSPAAQRIVLERGTDWGALRAAARELTEPGAQA